MQLTIPIPECQEAVRFPAGVLHLSEEEFFQLCQVNPDLRIERSPNLEPTVLVETILPTQLEAQAYRDARWRW